MGLWGWLVMRGYLAAEYATPLTDRSAGTHGRGHRTGCPKILARPAVAAFLGAVLIVLPQATKAQDTGAAYSALLDYARQIGGTAEPASFTPADDHAAFVALHDYARQLAGNRAGTAPIKLAEADNALDALRDFLKQHNGSTPATPAAPTKPSPAKPQEPVAQASYVGSKVCLGCHTQQAHEFSHTLMGRLQAQGKIQCETCHGPGSEHVRLGGGRGVGGIISFRSDDLSRTARENNAICLGCHERGERTLWRGSVHQVRGLACTNCHTIMKSVSRKNQLKTAFEPDTCYQCHQDKRAQTMFSSHMPIGEGKVVCSDCHNPHGSFSEALLRTDTVNETCYKCHAEKRGPFLFEHEPVRENCLNCHNPHGSVNDDMLKMSTPRLCMECHSLHETMSGINDVHSSSRACLNCHTAVHGSNSPAGAFLMR
jgi:DmsE family decaheme c-type cytochrome